VSNKVFRAFYDRQDHTIAGFFTLQVTQDGETTKLFDKLPARSGQNGFTSTDWVRSKSPIPKGGYFLWLRPLNKGQWAGERGIGEFFHISSSKDDPLIIHGPAGQQRVGVGLHPENKLPGSAGCIVLLADSEERRKVITELFALLVALGGEKDCLELTVL
jgi:hypothetical protein